MATKFLTRHYNSIVKVPKFSVIEKTSANPKLLDEIGYYQNIPTRFRKYFPNFAGRKSKRGKKQVMVLEYVPYNNLSVELFKPKFNRRFWGKCIDKLFLILDEFKTERAILDRKSSINAYNQRILIQKTEDEFNKLTSNKKFNNLINAEKLEINGHQYHDFSCLRETIYHIIENIDFTNFGFSFIHGDFCLSNILYLEENNDIYFKFVDPRGSYGKEGCFGNPLYDYAKLAHSFEGGYEYIIHDKFSLSKRPNKIKYALKNNHTEILSDMFYSKISRKNRNLIKLLEGLLFIGMVARHYENFKHQIVQYCTGVKLINEALSKL